MKFKILSLLAGSLLISAPAFATYADHVACIQGIRSWCKDACYLETSTNLVVWGGTLMLQAPWECHCPPYGSSSSNCGTILGYGYDKGTQFADNPPLCPKQKKGSVVNIGNQTLGENVPIVGAPFFFHYSTLWAKSKAFDYKVSVPVTGDAAWTGVDEFNVTTSIDGVTVDTQVVPNTLGQSYSYSWSGNIGSTPTLGSVKARVVIEPVESGVPGYPIAEEVPLGNLKAKLMGFGGWMPSIYHYYDNARGLLYRGDGSSATLKKKTLTGGQWMVVEPDKSVVYIFDSNGKHLQTKTGLTGSTLFTFNYGAGGLLSTIVDAFSRTTTFNRNFSGELTSITAPKGEVTTITLSSSGLISEIENPNSESYNMTYHSGTDLLATFQKPGLQTSTLTYDSDGFLTQDSHSGGYLFNLVRSYANNKINVDTTTGLGRVSNYVSTARVMNGSPEEELEYPSTGGYQSSTVTPTNINVTQDGINTQVNFVPDLRFGELASFVSSRSVSDVYTGRTQSVSLSSASDPFSIVTMSVAEQLNYDPSLITTTEYDGALKKFTVTTPLGKTQETTIDTLERPTSTKWANENTVSLGYTNQFLTSIDQGTRNVSFSYSSTSGLLQSVTNELSQTSQFAYDNAKRLRYMTLPDLRVIECVYDANGNIAQIVPPGKSPHVFTLNGHELPAGYAPPAIGGISTNTAYNYNDDKQITKITKPDGSEIDFHYYSTGRFYGLTTSEGSYSYYYDSSSFKVTQGSTPNGLYSNSGYNQGILNSISWGNNSGGISNFSRSLNSLRQISSETVASGDWSTNSTINYTYDNDGLLVTSGDLAITRSAATGRIASTSLGTVDDAWTHDSFGELGTYASAYGSTSLYNLSLTRDGLGRISTKAETILGTTNTYSYSYDTAGRLITVLKNGGSFSSYIYDSNSNRTGGSVGGAAVTGVYDSQDRLTSYNTYDFTYNLNGERLMKINTLTSQTTTYGYDQLGNLSSVTLPSLDVISYESDAFGRRITRLLNNSVTNHFSYQDQLRISAEMSPSGSVVKRFVWGTKGNVPDYMIYSSNKYRIVSDAIGSVILVVKDSDGSIAQKLEYDEFGRVLSDTNPGFQPFGFAGGLYDHQTGLVHFGAREYDPAVGRWMSKDPILFQGGDTNLFGYVTQDPINLIDPSGNCPWCIGAVVGGVASGVSAYLAGGDARTVAVSAAVGAVAGAASMGVSAFTSSLTATVAANAIIGGSANVATQLATGTSLGSLNYPQLGIGALAGGIGAGVGLGAGTAAFYGTPVLGQSVGVALARSNEFWASLLTGTVIGTTIEGADTCR